MLVFPDAGGTRETIRQMGDRLASMGYVALVPDIYYRAGEWAPFDVATLFTDEQERARLFETDGRAHQRARSSPIPAPTRISSWRDRK